MASHKRIGVREAITAAGATVVYLAPNSPDLNPIELVFSKLKWPVRSTEARTISCLWELLGRLLDQFSADECHNYLRHCGYATNS